MHTSPEIAYSPWIAFSTLLTREVMRYMKLVVQTVVAPFLSNLLFLAVFGGLMASRSSGLPEVPYIRFLMPGLVLMGALMSAFQNPVFSLISMKYQNTLQDLCQYPLSAASRFLAFALAGTLRGLLVGIMTYMAAGFFGGFAIELPLFFWAYLTVVCFISASGGIAAGLYFHTFEQANFVVSLLLMPALFLGGVFFNSMTAPSWLGMFARYNPLTSLIGEARRLFLGTGDFEAPVTIALAGVLCFGALSVAIHGIASGKGMKVE